jgi:hypothetical protein
LANGIFTGQGQVVWNPYFSLLSTSGTTLTPAMVLGHEFMHAMEPVLGDFLGHIPVGRYDNLEEFRVINGWETNFLEQQRLVPRTDHGASGYAIVY